MSSSLPAVLAAIAAIIAALLSYRSSAQANRIGEHQATMADYDAQLIRLQRIIAEQDRYTDRLRAEVERLSSQIDIVRKQIATEQDVSNALRSQIRALQGQLSALERLASYDARSRIPLSTEETPNHD